MISEEISKEMIKSRIILLTGEINELNTNETIMKLLYLDSLNNEDIYLYINSYGGVVSQGLAIIDCMNYIKSKVITICIGTAYSMAAVILSNGEKGKRLALPNSEIMIHQISSKINGKMAEINDSVEKMNKVNQLLTKIIADNSTQNYKQVFNNMKSDYFMDAKEAKKYGIIDKIIFKSV